MIIDLVGVTEAAAICEVEKPRIPRWVKAGRMPPTVAVLRSGPVWRREDVELLHRVGAWSGEGPHQLQLMGAAEAAAACGTDKKQIGRWRAATSRTPFPEPVAELANGPVWRARDVRDFADRRAAASAA